MYSFELDLHRGVKHVVYKFKFAGKNNSAVGLLIDFPLCNKITHSYNIDCFQSILPKYFLLSKSHPHFILFE